MFFNNVKLYMACDSGSERGVSPAKSLGAGLLNPRLDLIFFPNFQLAGNCEFKSTPLILAFQPEGKGISG